MSRLRDSLSLIILGAFVSALVSSLLGTAVLYATGQQAYVNMGAAWLVYWLGDSTGVLLVTPLILTASNFLEIRSLTRIAELLALVGLLALACGMIFHETPFVPVKLQGFAFALLPLILWAALRFGVGGVAVTTLVVAAIATVATALGNGPFVRSTMFSSAVHLDAFFAVLSVSGLLLAALMAERERAVRDHAAIASKSAARQTFLLALSDTIRLAGDPDAVAAIACRMLGEHLGVNRVVYCDVEGDAFIVRHSWAHDTGPPIPSGSLRTYGKSLLEHCHRGQTIVANDVASDSRFTSGERVDLAAREVGAFIRAILMKNEKFVGFVGTHQREPRVWTDTEIELVETVTHRIGSAIQQARADVTLRESEARQKVLVAELQHRTRNLIAVVQSIAGQSAANASSLEDFTIGFSDRLDALARVQGLLSHSGVEPINIGSLVQMELDAIGNTAALERVRVSGPNVGLHNSIVQILALALHELTTNALKHGALGSQRGRLVVTWELLDNAERHLVLVWQELDMNLSCEQQNMTHRGQGVELIEQALPYTLGARTSFALQESGAICVIDLPIDGIQRKNGVTSSSNGPGPDV
jgi:two-component sensor histidine kinase